MRRRSNASFAIVGVAKSGYRHVPTQRGNSEEVDMLPIRVSKIILRLAPIASARGRPGACGETAISKLVEKKWK